MEFWVKNPGYNPRYVDGRVKLKCRCGATQFIALDVHPDAAGEYVYECEDCNRRHISDRLLDAV